MPIYLRRFYSRKLLDVKTKESEQVKSAQSKAKSSSSAPRSKSSFR